MNLLGKSFSFIIFILSLCFMVLALAVNASHRNWRDVVMEGTGGQPGLKQQIETIESTNKQLRDSRQRAQAQLNREQAARQTAIASLQTQLDLLEEQLQKSEATVLEKEAKNTELTQLDASRAKALQELTDSNAVLRQQIRREQEDRDKLFAQTLEVTDDMNELRGIVQSLTTRNDQLASQVTTFKEVMDAHGINVDDPLDGAPPSVNGNVLVINRPRKLVELSIGWDDGLRAGHMLEVTRKDNYITKLKVKSADPKFPNRSVAEILDDYSEQTILEGDRVDTTLQ